MKQVISILFFLSFIYINCFGQSIKESRVDVVVPSAKIRSYVKPYHKLDDDEYKKTLFNVDSGKTDLYNAYFKHRIEIKREPSDIVLPTNSINDYLFGSFVPSLKNRLIDHKIGCGLILLSRENINIGVDAYYNYYSLNKLHKPSITGDRFNSNVFLKNNHDRTPTELNFSVINNNYSFSKDVNKIATDILHINFLNVTGSLNAVIEPRNNFFINFQILGGVFDKGDIRENKIHFKLPLSYKFLADEYTITGWVEPSFALVNGIYNKPVDNEFHTAGGGVDFDWRNSVLIYSYAKYIVWADPEPSWKARLIPGGHADIPLFRKSNTNGFRPSLVGAGFETSVNQNSYEELFNICPYLGNNYELQRSLVTESYVKVAGKANQKFDVDARLSYLTIDNMPEFIQDFKSVNQSYTTIYANELFATKTQLRVAYYHRIRGKRQEGKTTPTSSIIKKILYDISGWKWSITLNGQYYQYFGDSISHPYGMPEIVCNADLNIIWNEKIRFDIVGYYLGQIYEKTINENVNIKREVINIDLKTTWSPTGSRFEVFGQVNNVLNKLNARFGEFTQLPVRGSVGIYVKFAKNKAK